MPGLLREHPENCGCLKCMWERLLDRLDDFLRELARLNAEEPNVQNVQAADEEQNLTPQEVELVRMLVHHVLFASSDKDDELKEILRGYVENFGPRNNQQDHHPPGGNGGNGGNPPAPAAGNVESV